MKEKTLTDRCPPEHMLPESGTNNQVFSSPFTKEDYFKLLSQYYEELKHRDTLFWKQVFAYFYATLIVGIVPFIEPLGLHLPDSFPRIIFPITGLVMSFCFLFISFAYAERLACIGKTYSDLLGMLPNEMQRISIEQRLRSYAQKSKLANFYSKVCQKHMARIVPLVMFLLLSVLNSCLLLVTILVR